jgi:hypothetical protein
MKRSSTPKLSEVPALPIDEAKKGAEPTEASSTSVNQYPDKDAAVESVTKELADEETSGRN